MIMQQVLMKLIQACWNIVDILNNKFDEILTILGPLFDDIKAQAPNAEAYISLSLSLNKSI